MSIIAFGTGHRPKDAKHPFGKMVQLAIDGLIKHEAAVAICGMAAGWDLAFGTAALELEVPVWSVRPWAGHQPIRGDRALYEDIERLADRHIITNDSLTYPGPWCYQIRNEWMVDNGEEGLAYWDGKKWGGTWNCVAYAQEKGKLVHNLYPS